MSGATPLASRLLARTALPSLFLRVGSTNTTTACGVSSRLPRGSIAYATSVSSPLFACRSRAIQDNSETCRRWIGTGSPETGKYGEAAPPPPAPIEEEEEEPFEGSHPPESLDGDRALYTVPIAINMPDMGDGDDNLVEEWFKQPGDIIKRNDILCDITTPDFTFGMVTEDECDAIMGEIYVSAGEACPDNAKICTIYHKQILSGKEGKTENQSETDSTAASSSSLS